MKLASALVTALLLVGCQHSQPTYEIKYVDRPVPYAPQPPQVPAFESQVDKLTDGDAADPGKVGQAYKYDMAVLRALIAIHVSILEQYQRSAYDFATARRLIEKIKTEPLTK